MNASHGNEQPQPGPKKVKCDCGRTFQDENALSQHRSKSKKHAVASSGQSPSETALDTSDRQLFPTQNGPSKPPTLRTAQSTQEKSRGNVDREPPTGPGLGGKKNNSKGQHRHKQHLALSTQRHRPTRRQAAQQAETSSQATIEDINQLLREMSVVNISGDKQSQQATSHQPSSQKPRSQQNTSPGASQNQTPVREARGITKKQTIPQNSPPSSDRIIEPKRPDPTIPNSPTTDSTLTYRPRLWKNTITFVKGANLSSVNTQFSSPQSSHLPIHASSGGTSGFTDCYPLKFNPLTRRMMDMTAGEDFSACNGSCGMCGHCSDSVHDDYRRYVAD